MEKPTIHQLAWSSPRQVYELAAGESTVMLDLTREMTGIDHTPLITTKLHMRVPARSSCPAPSLRWIWQNDRAGAMAC